MPCMCGALDCPSCGPAQGYRVVKRWVNGWYRYVNPEEGEEDDDYDPYEDLDEPEYNEDRDER